MKNALFGRELFLPPYDQRITRVLPTLFNIAELENRRGNRLGMEVGTTRERILVALLMYVYGSNNVTFPPTNSPEADVIVNRHPISIKTKTGKSLSGVKLVWTVDWSKIRLFRDSYQPSSDIIYVNINWDDKGGFYLIPISSQRDIFKNLTANNYMKLPKQGTNPRGVEVSKKAMELLLSHPNTLSLDIQWKRDASLLGEQWTLYRRWVELWDML